MQPNPALDASGPRAGDAWPDDAGAPVVIEARGVGKRYEMQRHRSILLKDAARMAFAKVEKDYFWALRDVGFQVRKGETIAFVGPNGAGKSTLLSLIAKTAVPTEGTVQVTGRVSALLELGAGFHPDFTGRENIYINGIVMGLTRAQITEKMESIIAFSELGPFIDEPVRNYSSGMLARLGFSVAAEVDPDILIVDEALSVGDQGFQEKSYRRILDFQKRGCTIIFVTHGLDIVGKLCQRAVLLSHGQVLAEGPAREICADYLSRVDAHQLDGARPPYEKVQVAAWKRLLALVAVVSLVGGVATLGARFVLSKEMPEQRPPIAGKYEALSKPAE